MTYSLAQFGGFLIQNKAFVHIVCVCQSVVKVSRSSNQSIIIDHPCRYSDMGADDEEPCTSSSILRTPSNAKPKADRRRTGREMSEVGIFIFNQNSF